MVRVYSTFTLAIEAEEDEASIRKMLVVQTLVNIGPDCQANVSLGEGHAGSHEFWTDLSNGLRVQDILAQAKRLWIADAKTPESDADWEEEIFQCHIELPACVKWIQIGDDNTDTICGWDVLAWKDQYEEYEDSEDDTEEHVDDEDEDEPEQDSDE